MTFAFAFASCKTNGKPLAFEKHCSLFQCSERLSQLRVTIELRCISVQCWVFALYALRLQITHNMNDLALIHFFMLLYSLAPIHPEAHKLVSTTTIHATIEHEMASLLSIGKKIHEADSRIHSASIVENPLLSPFVVPIRICGFEMVICWLEKREHKMNPLGA